MRRALITAVVMAGLLAPATAGATLYAPVDRAGPPLSVPQEKLDAALQCGAGVDHASRAPVLLLHGTGSNSHDNWGWTYEPAFDALGIPWCALDSPQNGNGDIQESGEYVTSAIRAIYARAGRKIAIVGHSQGGMIGRWALRFWPDTRGMVDDVIAFAPTNHGTTQAKLACSSECSAASWQQRDDSNFIEALNSVKETFAGVSYTSIYTHLDEIVQPNSDSNGSSSLHSGDGMITNVATQDVCPLDPNEHLGIGTVDPVAYALAIDALNRAGPADPSAIDPLTCTQTLQPGVDPVTFPANAAQAAFNLETSPSTDIPREPDLRCYTLAAGCPATAAKPVKKKAKCKRAKKHRRAHKKCKRRKHRRH